MTKTNGSHNAEVENMAPLSTTTTATCQKSKGAADLQQANNKLRLVRPSTVYVVTHTYTCTHLYGDETTTDNIGAYYSHRNAVLGAVKFIKKEFDVIFPGEDSWEKEKVNNDEDEDQGDNEHGTIRELFENDEWTTEVETEGGDEHIIRIESISIDDRRCLRGGVQCVERDTFYFLLIQCLNNKPAVDNTQSSV